MHLPHVLYTMPACQKNATKAVYFGRDLAELKVLRVTQAGDQLLRLFAARIAFLSLVQLLYERVTVRSDSRTVESVVLRSSAISICFLNC